MEQPTDIHAVNEVDKVEAIATTIKLALGMAGLLYVRPTPYMIVIPELNLTLYCGMTPTQPSPRSITIHDDAAARILAIWIRRGV
jgi:hypothetical protein